MKKIAILGSTGSIGSQALEVIALHKELFSVSALCAYGSAELLIQQARAFHPQMLGLVRPPEGFTVPDDLKHLDWRFGETALTELATFAPAEDVLVSVVGIAGLKSVLAAFMAGRNVLLANKEALVAGGSIVMEAARASGCKLLPVDSEHSAIFQCLQAAGPNKPCKLLLTASGGPFRTWTREQIQKATLSEALKHPNWEMGRKITIDSATMFNKALEIIEAKWLFEMPPEAIEVVVHKESIVHSAIVFEDGAVLAQLGTPDMRLPILYAMSNPHRLTTGVPPPDLFALGSLSFEKGDPERFPALRLAYESLNIGGAACAVLNGANEAAVAAVLAESLPFGRIAVIVEETLSALCHLPGDTAEDIYQADALARVKAHEMIRGGRLA